MARLAGHLYLLVAAALALLLNGLAMCRVRAWNAAGQEEPPANTEDAKQKGGDGRKGERRTRRERGHRAA